MGRTTTWLAEERPAMIEIIAEMERGFASWSGQAGRGDLTALLDRLRQAVVAPGEQPRSIEAMRQAWWRWTADSSYASTPPVRDFALMVRHAKNHGWLRNLVRPDALALMDRLLMNLRLGRGSEVREREAAWGPVAQAVADDLVKALRLRAAEVSRTNIRVTNKGPVAPDAMLVQAEFTAMLEGFTRQFLRSLSAPRVSIDGIMKSPYLQPNEGWPDAFREMATDVKIALSGAADRIQAVEDSMLKRASAKAVVRRRSP